MKISKRRCGASEEYIARRYGRKTKGQDEIKEEEQSQTYDDTVGEETEETVYGTTGRIHAADHPTAVAEKSKHDSESESETESESEPDPEPEPEPVPFQPQPPSEHKRSPPSHVRTNVRTTTNGNAEIVHADMNTFATTGFSSSLSIAKYCPERLIIILGETSDLGQGALRRMKELSSGVVRLLRAGCFVLDSGTTSGLLGSKNLCSCGR